MSMREVISYVIAAGNSHFLTSIKSVFKAFYYRETGSSLFNMRILTESAAISVQYQEQYAFKV